MDVFRLNNTGGTWTQGTLIKGIDTKVWAERYRSPGEFTFTGKPTRELRNALPLDALISHTNTLDIMIVESHEIVEDEALEPKLTIKGRSLASFLEQRVATDDAQGFEGPNSRLDPQAEPNTPLFDGSAWPYVFFANTARAQARNLIRNQIMAAYVERPSFAIPHTTVAYDLEADEEDGENREVKRGPLHTAVMDVLADINAGLKVERPNGDRSDIWWIIHDGKNRKGTVQFSHEAGDLTSTRYYWSRSRDKDAAYIASKYWHAFWAEVTPQTGLSRRVMYLDASDVNRNPADAGAWGGAVVAAEVEQILLRRARKLVRRRKQTELLETTISNNNRYRYRRDYGIGDIVYVVGNYDVSDAMRVVEYTEAEDEHGETGWPTLARAPGY